MPQLLVRKIGLGWCMFNHEKIFRVHYRLPTLTAPATRSLASRQLAVEFIRNVLDGNGSIDEIKYDGKPMSGESKAELLTAAKNLPRPKEENPPARTGGGKDRVPADEGMSV